MVTQQSSDWSGVRTVALAPACLAISCELCVVLPHSILKRHWQAMQYAD